MSGRAFGAAGQAEGVRHEFREIHGPRPRFRPVRPVAGPARGPPAIRPRTSAQGPARRPGRAAAGLIDRSGGSSREALRAVEAALAKRPKVEGGGAGQVYLEPALARVFDTAEKVAEKAGDSFVTVERLLLALALEKDSEAGKILAQRRRHAAEPQRRDRTRCARAAPPTPPSAENAYDALKKYARDLTAGGARRQARSGDRPRRGNPPHHPGAVAPHQEQSGADRRARRRQDRDRRGPGAAHRQWRRAGEPEGQEAARARHGRADRRREISRRVRGAAEGRAAARSRRRTAASSCSSTRCTRWSAPARPTARWTPPTCSSRRWRAASCTASARPRSTNTRSTSRRTRRWRGASSRCSSSEPTRRGHRSRSCAASRRSTSSTTACASPIRAIVAAATLSNRYITDRFLPDKAIDLVDEAAARLKMQVDSKPEELDAIDREIMQLKIEQEALKKESDPGSKDAAEEARKGAGRAREAVGRPDRALEGGEGASCPTRRSSRPSSSRRAPSSPMRSARGEYQRAGELAYGRIPELEKKLKAIEASDGKRRDGRGGGHRRPRRAGRLALDRRAGRPDARRREGKAAAHGGASSASASSARPKPCRRSRPRCAARAPACRIRTGRSARSCSSGPTGVGKTELTKALAEYPVRRRDRADPHRHVGIHGEALGRAADRRASGLCRLRGGRRAHRGGAAAALSGDPVRRDREGAPGRVQRAAAGARRRPPDRRAGPHGRLPQHADRHDLEPRRRLPGQPAGRAGHRRGARPGDGGGALGVPAGVPQPRRRDHPVPPAQARADEPHRRHPDARGCRSCWTTARSRSSSIRRRATGSPTRATTRPTARGR